MNVCGCLPIYVYVCVYASECSQIKLHIRWEHNLGAKRNLCNDTWAIICGRLRTIEFAEIRASANHRNDSVD